MNNSNQKSSVRPYWSHALLILSIFIAHLQSSQAAQKSLPQDLDPSQGLFFRVFKQKYQADFTSPRNIQRSPTTGVKAAVNLHQGTVEAWVWSKSQNQYVLYQSFPVCNYTGDLGPKTRGLDYQTPEGFYEITSINENSKYTKALVINYPNEHDRAHGWTNGAGGPIEVHGSCISAGCLAMSQDIKTLVDLTRRSRGRSVLSIPIHIFPFPMTEENLKIARQKGPRKWLPFWENLKQGYDDFEKSHLIPESWYNPDQKNYSFTLNRIRSLGFKEKTSSIFPETSSEICTSPEKTATKANIKLLHDEALRIYNALSPLSSIRKKDPAAKAENLIGSVE